MVNIYQWQMAPYVIHSSEWVKMGIQIYNIVPCRENHQWNRLHVYNYMYVLKNQATPINDIKELF